MTTVSTLYRYPRLERCGCSGWFEVDGGPPRGSGVTDQMVLIGEGEDPTYVRGGFAQRETTSSLGAHRLGVDERADPDGGKKVHPGQVHPDLAEPIDTQLVEHLLEVPGGAEIHFAAQGRGDRPTAVERQRDCQPD